MSKGTNINGPNRPRRPGLVDIRTPGEDRFTHVR